jgi:hypothetical protein
MQQSILPVGSRGGARPRTVDTFSIDCYLFICEINKYLISLREKQKELISLDNFSDMTGQSLKYLNTPLLKQT